ncbi:sugar ABC transporter substrate-binding protein [Quadrisphaera oryzae]|uniref:sugar ABC transporter substrate-binding protein n=1 Tax=Quadrisphaera TaxID=317661 RepID=UPI0016461119|nr:extracellular solute-binding protein [Quadrisphaera sp. RL12-1S]MBC3761796.1 extracellular solute-binding protein [Quadrisphaera sp. RL12-1S]
MSHSTPTGPSRSERSGRRARRSLASAAVLAAGVLVLSACGGSGFSDTGSQGSSGGASSGGGQLQVLIGSSGQAETTAVTDAVAAWSKESGTPARVSAASDLAQELSQGFAAKTPPDVFYVSSDLFNSYAASGALEPYGDQLSNAGDFYPVLKQAFTRDGKLYCAPKDFSTLALVINTDLWSKAGLTDADIPTTWDQLKTVSQKLTGNGVVGLSTSAEYSRLGAFMAEAGGGLVKDGKAVADSQQNVEALQYVQSLESDGSFKFAKDLGAGWGGEAFGTGKAAMTIEGNWLVGSMASDYPNVKYKVVELPAGPAGKGTLTFTNCWGVAADSKNKEAAVKLVEDLTSSDQQLSFAKSFGVMPSLQSAAQPFQQEFPAQAAFLAGASYATAVPNQEGVSDVITDLNSQLEGLGTGDPKAILQRTQTNLEAALKSSGS